MTFRTGCIVARPAIRTSVPVAMARCGALSAAVGRDAGAQTVAGCPSATGGIRGAAAVAMAGPEAPPSTKGACAA